MAGLWGMLAALTRPPGILLVLPLLVMYMAQRRYRWQQVDLRLGWLLLVPAGLLLYMLYLDQLVGNPLAFVTQQERWGRSFSAPWTPLLDFLKAPRAFGYQGALLDFLVAGLVIALLPAVWLKLGNAYGIYALASILVPLTSGSLASISRYSLVVFPVFFVLADWGRNRLINGSIMALSAPLAGMLMVFFVTWQWAN